MCTETNPWERISQLTVAESAVWLDPLLWGYSVPEYGVGLHELLCKGRSSVMDKIQNPKHVPNPQWSASASQVPPWEVSIMSQCYHSGAIGGSRSFQPLMPCTHLSAHHIKTHHICIVGTSKAWIFVLFWLAFNGPLFIEGTVKWFGRPELSQKGFCLSVAPVSHSL